MSNAELKAAFDKRLDGLSWEEIGLILHYDGNHVRREIYKALKSGKRHNRRLPNDEWQQVFENQFHSNLDAFAAACQVSRNTIENMISGKRKTKPETLEKIQTNLKDNNLSNYEDRNEK